MSRLDQDSLDQDLLALRTDLRSLHYSVETNNRNRHAEKTPIPSTMNSPVQLPPFAICEKLAILYFDNMEHCFRVLHWPEFRDQLSTLFEEGEDACSFGFIPQLVGVLTVAVLLATHPECATAAACSVIQTHPSYSFHGKLPFKPAPLGEISIANTPDKNAPQYLQMAQHGRIR